MACIALTVVKRVISFFSLSIKIGQHDCNSFGIKSPK